MEEQEGNLIVQNTSMEKDESIKELSMEDDILGAESLLMSDSDEEVNGDCTFKINQSPRKKISLKRNRRILDSDDEGVRKIEEATLANKHEFEINKTKISAVIDSVSDLGQDSGDDDPSKKLTQIDENVKGEEVDKGYLEEDQIISKLDEISKRKSKKENGISLEQNITNSNSAAPENEKIGKLRIEENSDTDDTIEIKKTNSLSLIDSESSDAETEMNASDLEASARQANFENNIEKVPKESNKKLKVLRASAKKAMDEMQTIQSEQQRLHREAHISIPYHKPRKHTLEEFLMRRIFTKPQKAGSVVASIPTRSLKMTTEELEEYAKLMEERAKEATEFFKSESEDEQDEASKDNEGVLGKPAKVIEQNKIEDKFPLDLPIEESSDEHNNITAKISKNRDGLQLTEAELTTLLAEEEQMPHLAKELERPTCSKVLITEIIELPKLDMNTVQISPPRNRTLRSSLNVKKLLADKKLSDSPSLSGDPNKLIDLETGNLINKNPTGMENLMNRLMSSIKARKSKNPETCSILSVENGKLEMSKVNISRTEANDPQKEAKPRAAYFELKKNLKEIIKKKRLEEMNKKQEDELEYSKCLADDDDDYDDKVEEDDSEEMYAEEYEPDDNIRKKFVMVDEEENCLAVKDDSVETIVDEEDAEYKTDDDNEYEGDVDEDVEDNEYYNNTESSDKSQRKNRIIKAFDDTDEEEGENDDIDFLKTQPTTTQPPPLLETQVTVKTSLEDEERELMALCSGTFDPTPKTSVSALMSQIPITQNCGKQVNDEELMQLCSGTFDQPSVTLQALQIEETLENLKTKCTKILSSDEEGNDNEQNEIIKQKSRRSPKKLKKKKTKLGFSDDEDDDKDEEEYEYDKKTEQVYDDDDLKITADEEETFVDYDSEENEIIVKMTKNEKVKQAQNFFEKEAELSESEWGSADEDENNLDKYDIELGDEDEFDKEKLQTELGQIHARKMLDEDIREVRKIQAMLFEDEEQDGVGRQRTFKWKNAESGFSLDDGQPLDENGNGQNGDSGDEINEHQWRKIRYEREQFLKKQGLKPDSQDTSTVLPNSTILLNSTGTTAKKLQVITAKKATLSNADAKNGSAFLISKAISAKQKKSVRGSFLVRDKETLNKLAFLTKGTSSSITVSNMNDAAGTVSVKNVKPKNFVFATLTEEEHESIKRKADDLLNSSNENGKNFMKKPKNEPRRDKCFIDQLL